VKTSKNRESTIELVRALVIEVVESLDDKKKRAKPYDDDLLVDPSFEKKSVYVPHDIKKSIKKWARDMKLDGR
jgi:hypothetical protein